MTVALRPFAPADLRGVVSSFVAAWRAGYREVVPPEVLAGVDDESVTRWLGPLVADRSARTVVAVDGAGVAGFVRFGPDPDRADPGAGYVAALYVHPRAGGSGLGRRLLEHALAELARAGRCDIRLWVFEANERARRLYERAGFRPDGARTVDQRWQAPQVRLRRAPRNAAVPLPPLPDVSLGRVDRFDVEQVRRPLRRPFRTALREVRELAGWRVTLGTAEGLTAVGTAVATPQITGDTDASIGAALAGPVRDAVAAGGPAATLLDAVATAGAGTPSAAAAVDVAVHGLVAAALGRPLREVLGAAAGEPPPSVVTVAVDSPAAMAGAAAALASEGVGALKLKLADAETDVARVLAVRDRLAGTPVTLRVDANQAWTPEQAVAVLDALRAAGIELELVEQPVAAADLAGLAFVTARSPWPVLADESVFTGDDVRRVADAHAADLVAVKLAKSGGLRGARDVVAACAETGLGLLVGCMLEPEEGVAAAAALAAAASRGPLAHDLDAPWWLGGVAAGR